VVTAREAPNGTERIPSRRRRRRGLAVLLGVWTLVVAGSAFAWYEYGRISNDLGVSNRRVGGAVQHALTPVPVGASEQTTLVAGIDSHEHAAGSVVLARMDGHRHAVAILTVPSTTAVSTTERLRDVLRRDGVARAIGLLERDLAIPVNHVLLIHLGQTESIVRSLGGITVANPTPVEYDARGGSGVFPAGRLRLTGRTVRWYLDPAQRQPTPTATTAGDSREAAVVRGVTEKLVHITTPSAMNAVGATLARGFTTDFSPVPVLGIVAVRLRANTLVDCRLGAVGDLATAASNATVVGFRTASQRGACRAQPLTTTLPASAVAATIIATLISHGGSRLLYLLVVATVAVWGIAAVAWVLMLPSTRGVRRQVRTRSPRPRLRRREPPSYSARSRRRRRTAALALRIASVPASIGLGMLIAHVLY
jgi:hypothetical protein